MGPLSHRNDSRKYRRNLTIDKKASIQEAWQAILIIPGRGKVFSGFSGGKSKTVAGNHRDDTHTGYRSMLVGLSPSCARQTPRHFHGSHPPQDNDIVTPSFNEREQEIINDAALVGSILNAIPFLRRRVISSRTEELPPLRRWMIRDK